MKITLEAESEAEREHFPDPVVYPLSYEFVVSGWGATGRFSWFHGDSEVLAMLVELNARRLKNAVSPNPT
jgi:hypothetical protein